MSTGSLPPDRNPVPSSESRSGSTIRRQPSQQQGMALEKLGHAIEYLIDSAETVPPDADRCEAIELLSSSSRKIFLEGREILSLRDKIVPLRKKISQRASAAWRPLP